MKAVMNWKDLIAEVTAVGAGGDSAESITGVEYDSRRGAAGLGLCGDEGRLDRRQPLR